MKTSWIREPLVHFLAIGLLLFVAYYAVQGDRGTEDDLHIVVSESDIDWLKANFARTWSRQPAPSELEGLIEEYIREEVYYREALALGLEVDDMIIRRRLVQKIEFLSEDLALRARTG